MNNEIEYVLCDAAYLWRRVFNVQSKHLGISNIERRIIIKVETNPGATQVEIANLLEMDPQNLIRPLDKLVAEQLIEKRNDPKDRRSKCLFLTPKCQPMIAKINSMADMIRPQILAGLTEKEIQHTIKNLTRIKQNLEKYLS